jgi:hypothetical protein
MKHSAPVRSRCAAEPSPRGSSTLRIASAQAAAGSPGQAIRGGGRGGVSGVPLRFLCERQWLEVNGGSTANLASRAGEGLPHAQLGAVQYLEYNDHRGGVASRCSLPRLRKMYAPPRGKAGCSCLYVRLFTTEEPTYPMSPSTGIVQSQVYFPPVEQILSCLPPLQHTFASWHTSGSTETAHFLELREAALGAATLSSASLRLLYEIASQQIQALRDVEPLSAWHARPVHERITLHAASYSAAQTQAVLPPGALVQKTVTIAMAGKLMLCTCVGDRKLERTHLRAVADALALPRRGVKHCSINPSTCDPVVEYGMLPGMVSPFLLPLQKTRVAAVVLLPWPRWWEDQGREVAVSLSLWESLLLPLRCLKDIVRSYARSPYPPVHLIELRKEENHGDE